MKLGYAFGLIAFALLFSLMPLPKVDTVDQSDPMQNWEWIEEPITTHGRVSSCDFTSVENGWAVGENGTILHWDGTRWSDYPSPRSGYVGSLNSVDLLSTDEGWAVGVNGYVLYWDGKEWKDVSYPTDNDILSVSFASNNFGIATGGLIENDRRSRFGLIWDRKAWRSTTFPKPKYSDTDPRIVAVEMLTDQDGWAAGYGELYHWNGKGWDLYPLETNRSSPFREVHNFSKLTATDIWAAGYAVFKKEDGTRVDGGGILHWNGTDWQEIYQGPYNLSSIRMLFPTMGWAVGAYRQDMKPKAATDNMIYYWDGKEWSEFTGKNGLALYTLCGFDEDHLWIFGGYGTLRLSHKTLPTQTPNPTTEVRATLEKTLAPTKTSNPTVSATLPRANGGQGNKTPFCPSTAFVVGGVILFFLLVRIRSKS